jgi:hypothetical protein
MLIRDKPTWPAASIARTTDWWLAKVGSKGLERRLLIPSQVGASGLAWAPDGTRIA